MTQSLSTAADISVLLLLGVGLIVYGTIRAVQKRHEYTQLILWGSVTDIGLVCMGLGAASAIGTLGVLLFAVFQCLARALAWVTLHSLGAKKSMLTADNLTAAGVRNPAAGYLFALGMLAVLGGAPFWLPEGRAFIVQALVTGGLLGGIVAPVIMAASATCFIWLHVDAVRNVVLEKADTVAREACVVSSGAKMLAIAIAIFGIMRMPITTFWANTLGATINHPATHTVTLLLYGGAILTVLLGYYKKNQFRDICSIVFMFLGFCVALGQPGSTPATHMFTIMITGIGFVASLYSKGYMQHGHRVTQYQFFLLLTFAALVGVVNASDLTEFYGFWEIMTFASYFLVVHEANSTAFKAGLKYYVMCAGGAFVMLPGLMMLAANGTAYTAIPESAYFMPNEYLKAALLFVLAGLAVKAGLVPLHSWLPDAHPAAPSSISGPLSGVITKTGIFGIVVIILGQAGYASQNLPGQSGLSWIGYGISFMGGLTLVLGELMALKQDDIKRMLAYSTLGQLGEIALVLGLGTWLATTGALAHVFNHAIMKDLLFFGAGALILRVGSRNLNDLRGLAKSMPWTVSCMVVGLISIMGLPPFAGFFSKYLMIQATVSAGYPILGVLILAGSFVGVVYYTRILKTLVFEERPAHLPVVKEAPLSMRLAMGILAVASLVLGLAPQLSLAIIIPIASAYFVPQADAVTIIQSVSVSWPIYVIVPLLGAFVPVILRKDRVRAGWSAVIVLLVTALCVLLFGRGLDNLSFAFALIVPLIGALNMAYAVGYMEHSHTQWRFYATFCCMCAGLIGVAAAQYLFSFFLFWEIMSSWTLYFAIAHEGTKDALREAFKYFLFNIIGAGFIFVGVTILGAYTPITTKILWQGTSTLPSWAATTGIVLLAIGFIMKAAQLPFRIDWQMHPALAPTPVSGYISSVLLKSAILGLTKLFMLLGSGLLAAGVLNATHETIIQTCTMWVGGITIIMASIQALMASNLKLVFIYSTVSQIGYMVLAVGVGSALGYAGGLLHVANHVFFKDLLFLICGAIMLQSHKDSLEDLGGIGRKMPFTLTMFAIAGLSVVGVPPTSGFTSKWIIYHALMEAGQPLLALLSLIGSVITLAYIAKFLHAAFMGQPGPHLESVTEAPKVMRVPMLILGIGCIVSGVFPGLLLTPINSILGNYGIVGLNVGLSGVLSGTGAWDATGMAIMMFIAFYGGWKFVTHFVDANSRLTDVHSCGIAPEVATSRMQPSSIYAGLMGMLMRRNATKEN